MLSILHCQQKILQSMSYQYSYPLYKQQPRSHCSKCYKSMKQQQMFKQQICGAHYCPQCICSIFQFYYLSKQPDAIVQLYCSHFVDRAIIEKFLQFICISCGKPYDPAKDVQLNQGFKLCKLCYDYQGSKYRDFLLECMSCNRIIRSLKFAATNSELLLCEECTQTQSKLQSVLITNLVSQDNNGSTHKNTNNVSLKDESSEEPSQQLSIVSRFSAFDIDDNQNNGNKSEQNHSMHKLKITSKHSVEIRVENLKIQIAPDKQSRKQTCSICNCYIVDSRLIKKDEKSKELICPICLMENFDSREISFSKSFASSRDSDRLTHTSVPKKKLLPESEARQDIKYMKKSGIQPIKQDNTFKSNQYSALSYIKPTVHQLEPWEQPATIQKQKQCQICGVKKYNIIRGDQKKVCTGCYAKK